jgi:hypothetical protein
VCGSGCPYSNVQAAIQAAQAGDLVRILEGEYTESLTTVSVTPLYIEYQPPSNPEKKLGSFLLNVWSSGYIILNNI